MLLVLASAHIMISSTYIHNVENLDVHIPRATPYTPLLVIPNLEKHSSHPFTVAPNLLLQP